MSKKNTGLSRIFANHKGKVSDKWSIYLDEYGRLFETYRNRPVRLLEIGVQNGGSLEIWGQYFVNAKKLVGCDINPDCAELKFNDPRIALVIANANTDEAQQVILGYSHKFDLIIDDGSHQSEDIVCSFARYFTYLNDGGLYIAEDLHCSYWQDFDGGLLHPYSSMAFFKRLADVINHEHWGVDKSGAELLQSFKNKYNAQLDEAVLSRIHSIEFINSMCVIKKASPANNVLGIRHVSGSIAVVNDAPLTLNGSVCPQSNQIENQFSVGNLAIEEELEIKTNECNTLNQYINDLNEKISAVKQDASEREQLLLIELDQVRLKIENYSIELADRERAYSQQLQLMQQAHEQQIVEQARSYNELYQLVNAEYKAREDELNNLIAKYNEIERNQIQLINNLQIELSTLLNSNSWRFTSLFRQMSFFKKNNNTQQRFAKTQDPEFINSYSNKFMTDFIPTSLDELISLHDKEFIDSAYKVLLGRPPDSEGYNYYLSRIRSGISKEEILAQLRFSAEGKTRKVDVTGLDKFLKKHRRHTLLIRFLFGFLESNKGERFVQRKLSAIENKLYVQDTQLQKLFLEVSGVLDQLNKIANNISLGVDNRDTQSNIFDKQTNAEKNTDLAELSPIDLQANALTLVSLPERWPAILVKSNQIQTILASLEQRSNAKFETHVGKKDSRNRYPYRMMQVGDRVNQYFVVTEDNLASLTLFFYTYMRKNGASVRVNLFIILSDMREHKLASRLFKGDEITDCGAVHIWYEPLILGIASQIFRIEIIIEDLEQFSNISVALGQTNTHALREIDINLESKCAISFEINQAPSLLANKFFAFISGCPGDAFRYRCTHIGEAIRRIGYAVDVFHPGEQVWETLIDNYKVVILHRVAYDKSVEKFLEKAREKNVITIFDTDDLIFDPSLVTHIDAYNEMEESEKKLYMDGVVRYKQTLSECDYVSVSTNRLEREVVRLWPEKTVGIIRNRVSKEMIQLAKRAMDVPHKASTNVVIAYFSGTKTHRKDFLTCESALLKILEKYTHVRLLIVGHLEVPDIFAKVKDRIEFIPFIAWESLASLYRRVDINLAPLEYNNEFTESKSELKFLEAGLLSIPTVAANVGAYADTIENGVDGLLCSNPNDWFIALERLVLNSALRKSIGESARDKVEKNSTTMMNGKVIQNIYKSLLTSERSLNYQGKPRIAFVLRAPIAKTGGGYKKIFILANYLKKSFLVDVYVEPLAHLSQLSDLEIAHYCEKHFDFDHRHVIVGHDRIEPADVVIATNWPTAPTVNSLDNARVKLYFVQDYEAEFYDKKDPYYEESLRTYDLDLSIITIGDYLKTRLSAGGSWCRSIPFAIDDAFLTAKTKELESTKKNCTILFFARPNIPRRNFQAGVDALQMINKKYPKIKIFLYGLEEYIELPFNYENVGQIKQEELAALMTNIDIHLSYSMTNITTVIYEAMACGCACVEANVEPVRGMVNHGFDCLLAEPTGLGTFQVLSKLIDDPLLRRKLSTNGQLFAKTLTEENMCMSFQNHIKDILYL